ncbi:MAG: hypothetical protein WC130_11345 [Kiritimatiellia bacterium]
MMLQSETLRLRAAKDYIRNPYAWPGGYPKALITADGGCLCVDCVKKEWRQICWESFQNTNYGFRVAGVDVNYENTELYCDHCGKHMESAYGESE